MTRLPLIAAALLCTATPAFAEDYRLPTVTPAAATVAPISYRIAPEYRATQLAARKWEHAYLVLSAIDGAQTIYCVNITKQCTEANPLLGKHPSTVKIVAFKLATGAAHYALFSYVNDRDPKTALRLAQVSAIAQGGVVGLNFRVVF